MAKDDFLPEHRSIQLEIKKLDDEPFLMRAHVREGMSEISEITAEFLIKNRALKLQDLIGKDMIVHLTYADPKKKDEILRSFPGVCVTAEYVGDHEGFGHYVAEIRPWLWFLGRTRDCRIFQSVTTVDIIKEVFADLGFSDYVDKLNGSYDERTYCVQYRETDLAFLNRLMEEEGIYYYFDNSDGVPKLVLADGEGAHPSMPNTPSVPFYAGEQSNRDEEGYIFDWQEKEAQVPGKVTLRDYDFERPTADQTKVNIKEVGSHAYKDYELYNYPGHYRGSLPGDARARVRMQAETAIASTRRGGTSERNLTVGTHFKLTDGPRKNSNGTFLVLRAEHWLQAELDPDDPQHSALREISKIEFYPGNEDTYRGLFEAMPFDIQFRAPLLTPWPEIPGLQTAVVTGPGGEEIHTDQYGRIKVKFHWDRAQNRDAHSSCWLRTVMPWTGKNWGMIAIPRIGQEVVVQFEEGDPDRPVCTGMLYNADTMPPYPLPANKTMTGMTTRSTQGGNASTFHEMVFEDKIGEEYVRMQSERDYYQIVKNDAVINIGGGHADLGDLTQTVKRNKTEFVGEVRTHMVGLLEDLSVGLVYDESVGIAKTQTIGLYKEEEVGLTIPGLENLASDLLDIVVTVGGPISTLVGGKWADAGAAATAVNGMRKSIKPGKLEKINGVSKLEVTGDRIEEISKSKFPSPSKPGDMKTTVKDGKQEITIETGDREINVKKGKLKTDVEKGDYFVKIGEGNHLTSVLKGDRQVGVEKGDLITGVDGGDYKETVKKGDYTLKCDLGKVEIEAMKSITLKVGTSKIVIDQKGVTINGSILTFDATAVASLEGPMVKVSADSICTIDGTPVLIN